jgi:predicted secreted acid phosphatase
MKLGRRFDNRSYDNRKNQTLIFYDCADFLQYTKDLQGKVFHISTYKGNPRKKTISALKILGISNNKDKDIFKTSMYHLSYFEFVDFLIEWMKEETDRAKRNINICPCGMLFPVIEIMESLFNTFANEKYYDAVIW